MSHIQGSVQYDHLVKVVMIGDSGVGKTNFLQRFISGKFRDIGESTIGVEFASKIIRMYDGTKIKVSCWDTAGQERYRSITSAYYRQALGALIFYDISSRKSFNTLQRWIDELRQHASSDLLFMIVGNKADLSPQEISIAEIEEFCASLSSDAGSRVLFFEASAKTGQNVDESFHAIVSSIYEKHLHSGESTAVTQGARQQPADAFGLVPESKTSSEVTQGGCCSGGGSENASPTHSYNDEATLSKTRAESQAKLFKLEKEQEEEARKLKSAQLEKSRTEQKQAELEAQNITVDAKTAQIGQSSPPSDWVEVDSAISSAGGTHSFIGGHDDDEPQTQPASPPSPDHVDVSYEEEITSALQTSPFLSMVRTAETKYFEEVANGQKLAEEKYAVDISKIKGYSQGNSPIHQILGDYGAHFTPFIQSADHLLKKGGKKVVPAGSASPREMDILAKEADLEKQLIESPFTWATKVMLAESQIRLEEEFSSIEAKLREEKQRYKMFQQTEEATLKARTKLFQEIQSVKEEMDQSLLDNREAKEYVTSSIVEEAKQNLVGPFPDDEVFADAKSDRDGDWAPVIDKKHIRQALHVTTPYGKGKLIVPPGVRPDNMAVVKLEYGTVSILPEHIQQRHRASNAVNDTTPQKQRGPKSGYDATPVDLNTSRYSVLAEEADKEEQEFDAFTKRLRDAEEEHQTEVGVARKLAHKELHAAQLSYLEETKIAKKKAQMKLDAEMKRIQETAQRSVLKKQKKKKKKGKHATDSAPSQDALKNYIYVSSPWSARVRVAEQKASDEANLLKEVGEESALLVQSQRIFKDDITTQHAAKKLKKKVDKIHAEEADRLAMKEEAKQFVASGIIKEVREAITDGAVSSEYDDGDWAPVIDKKHVKQALHVMTPYGKGKLIVPPGVRPDNMAVVKLRYGTVAILPDHIQQRHRASNANDLRISAPPTPAHVQRSTSKPDGYNTPIAASRFSVLAEEADREEEWILTPFAARVKLAETKSKLEEETKRLEIEEEVRLAKAKYFHEAEIAKLKAREKLLSEVSRIQSMIKATSSVESPALGPATAPHSTLSTSSMPDGVSVPGDQWQEVTRKKKKKKGRK